MQFGYHKGFGFGIISQTNNDFLNMEFKIGQKNIIRTFIELIPQDLTNNLIEMSYKSNYTESELNNAKTISFNKVQFNEKSNTFILIDQYDNTISVEYNNGNFTTICSCSDTFNCIHGLAALVYLSSYFNDIQQDYIQSKNINEYFNQKMNYLQIKELLDKIKDNNDLLTDVINKCNSQNQDNFIKALCLCNESYEFANTYLNKSNLRTKRDLFNNFVRKYEFNNYNYRLVTNLVDGNKQRLISISNFNNKVDGLLYALYNNEFDEIIKHCIQNDLTDGEKNLFKQIYKKLLNDYDYSNINFYSLKFKNKEILNMIYPHLDKITKEFIDEKFSKSDKSDVLDLIEEFFDFYQNYYKMQILEKIKALESNEPLLKALEGSMHFNLFSEKMDGIIEPDDPNELENDDFIKDLFEYFRPMVKVDINDNKEIEVRYYLLFPDNQIALKAIRPVFVENDIIEYDDEIEFRVNCFAGDNYVRFCDVCDCEPEELAFFSYCDNAYKKQIETLIIRRREELEAKLKKERLSKINGLIKEFSLNNNEYKVNENIKAKLEVYFTTDYNDIKVQFKIGVNKMYVVKNTRDFLRYFINNDYYKYGKSFSFTHNTNQLEHPYDEVIKSLLLVGVFDYNYRGLSISPTLFNHILDLLKGTYISIDNHLYYLDLSEKTLKTEIDENMVLNLNITDDQFLYEFYDTMYIFDDKNSVIYKLKNDTRYKNFIKFAREANGTDLSEVIEKFNDEIYPYVNRYLEVSPMVSSNFKLSDLEIISYFDIDNIKKKLTVKEEYKRDNISILKSNFKNQDTRKYDEYLMYLESLGFYEGKIEDEDKIFEFLNMDFSHLKELCSVYLSESIQSHQVMTFQSPQIKIHYNSGIMECIFEESVYSNEELAQIYEAMKLRKKYIRLKNDRIVDIQDYYEFSDIVDDLHINKKNMLESTQLPIYQALQAYAHKDMIEIDDYLKKMIDELTNFKNSKFELPNVNAELRGYQKEGFNWLYILSKYHMGGILADDMGLGKTLQMITLIASTSDEMPSLIVCPKSLTFNWKMEFEKFYLNGIDVYQINGSSSQREDTILKIDNNKRAVYITSYDSLRNDIDLYKNIIFKYIILDEAQYIKNVTAGKSLAVKQLKGDVKYALTGTPIENNVIDLWSIFDFIMPGYFEDLKVFRVKYNSNENYVSHIAKKASAFILRRTKKNVLKDLPPKFETIVQASMTPSQRKLYDAQMVRARNSLMAGARAFDMLPVLTRLRQLCVDPRTFVDEYDGEGGKITLLRELIPNYINDGHKILIFSQYVKVLKLIEDILNDMGLRYYLITGDTKAEDRLEYSNRFNASDEVKVFLVSLKAGGTGLNLVGADVVIHTDPWWNQAVEDQASDRAYRIGQKKNVEVVKLICENSIEQRVVELQNMKRDIIDKVISNDESSVINASLEDIHFVLKE